MALQVDNRNLGTIGRMFARQNVPNVYGKQKAAGGEADNDTAVSAMDRVSFSSNVPQPLSARVFEEASTTGSTLASGGRLSTSQEGRIRADRVFAAVSALALMGATGESADAMMGWPGGLPAPTAEELDAARRRLSQRFVNANQAENPEIAASGRVELLRKVAGMDFEAQLKTEN